MTSKPFKRPSIVEVEWLDSMGYPGWQDGGARLDSMAKVEDMDHFTTGYLLKQTRAYVAVSLSVGRTGSVGDSIQIPRQSIKRVRVLRKAGTE